MGTRRYWLLAVAQLLGIHFFGTLEKFTVLFGYIDNSSSSFTGGQIHVVIVVVAVIFKKN